MLKESSAGKRGKLCLEESEMSKATQNTKLTAESHGLQFKDCGGGHVQISGHGVLVNYWPESKKRTAHIPGGKKLTNCTPWDAVQFCLTNGKGGLRPEKKAGKKVSKNGPDFDLRPVKSKSVVKHLYDGELAPWEYEGPMIMCEPDRLRVEAYQIRGQAIELEAQAREQEEDLTTL